MQERNQQARGNSREVSSQVAVQQLLEEGLCVNDEFLQGKGLPSSNDRFGYKGPYTQVFGNVGGAAETATQKMAQALVHRLYKENSGEATEALQQDLLKTLRSYGVEMAQESLSASEIISSIKTTFHRNRGQFELEALAMLFVLEELEGAGAIRIDSFSRTDLSEWEI